MTESKSFNLFFKATLVALCIIYCIGMRLSLMDVDASQYALISKDMFHSGNFLQIYDRGRDYLDKPPLLFWTACLSFKIFWVHDWAYRLPSVMCLVLGLYSIYRYTKLFYDESTAKIAVLIMASCAASYLMTHDVRTDTMLTGLVMFSIWQLAEFNRSLKLKNILRAAVGIGLAMLTKGPIGLIIPVTAFSAEFIYQRQWKSFFRWQYLVALVIISIMLVPMSYGLYEQFDLHPEKIEYDIKGISGLRFYYWTQSFGRITGESKWNNNPDPFFLVHSFCWSFLPWTAFFIPALFIEIKNKIKGFKSKVKTEAITIGGFLLVFLFLSRSNYLLPHYTFPLHTLAAIITANYLNKNILHADKSRLASINFGVQIFVMFVLYVGTFLLVDFVFPTNPLLNIPVILSLGVFIAILFSKKISKMYKVLLSMVLPFITLAFVLNVHFYPNLLDFQISSRVAKDLNKIASDDSKLLIFRNYIGNCALFYSKIPVNEYIDEKTLPDNLIKGKTYILADSADTKAIQQVNPNIVIIKKYDAFGVTGLNGKFLNPATRNSAVEKKVLLYY
jgi:4-amino-4-deoxy-L-arabinose transferase-like glycosyltransferase